MALALPATEERPSYNGTASFRVKSRTMFAREREDGESIALKIDPGEREALVAMQPETFVVTPHYENHPVGDRAPGVGGLRRSSASFSPRPGG